MRDFLDGLREAGGVVEVQIIRKRYLAELLRRSATDDGALRRARIVEAALAPHIDSGAPLAPCIVCHGAIAALGDLDTLCFVGPSREPGQDRQGAIVLVCVTCGGDRADDQMKALMLDVWSRGLGADIRPLRVHEAVGHG